MWIRKRQIWPSLIGSHRVMVPPNALAASASGYPMRVPWPVPPELSAMAVVFSTLNASRMAGSGMPDGCNPSASRPPVDRGVSVRGTPGSILIDREEASKLELGQTGTHVDVLE
jgi:hypothetical protein